MEESVKIVTAENGYAITVEEFHRSRRLIATSLAEALRIAADVLEPQHEIMIANEPGVKPKQV